MAEVVGRTQRAVRRAATVVTLLTAIVLMPSPAGAANVYTPTNAVRPVLECVGRASDGSYTAVLGYTNSAGAKTIPRGPWNSFSPTKYDGTQPTQFKAGTQHGVMSLKLTSSDYTSGGTSWMLDGNLLFIGAAFASGIPTCTPVQMPAEGNDAGSAIVLVVAGLVGALVLMQMRRRAAGKQQPRA